MIQWDGQDVINDVHGRILANMRHQAERVIQVAQQLAPRKSGYMADNLDYTIDETTYSVVFFGLAEYTIFQEYGTRYIRAAAFIRRALQQIYNDYGWNLSIAFQNVPKIKNPIVTTGSDYLLPKGLTRKQRRHVAKNLKPVAKKWFKGSVTRARLRVHRNPF